MARAGTRAATIIDFPSPVPTFRPGCIVPVAFENAGSSLVWWRSQPLPPEEIKDAEGASDVPSPVAAVFVAVGAAGSLSSLLWRRQPGLVLETVQNEVAVVTTVAIVQPICTLQTTHPCANHASENDTAWAMRAWMWSRLAAGALALCFQGLGLGGC